MSAPCGSRSAMVTPSSTEAMPGMRRLIASRSRAAVRKSALNRLKRTTSPDIEAGGDRALDAGAFGDPAHGWNIDRQLRAVLGRNAEAAHRKVALRHGVDLAVRAIERSHDQHAAAQDLALPMVETVTSMRWPGLAKCGQIGSDHHGGGVLEPGRNAGRQLQLPMRPETPRMACVRYSRLSSPVPGRPTTTP